MENLLLSAVNKQITPFTLLFAQLKLENISFGSVEKNNDKALHCFISEIYFFLNPVNF